MNLKSIIISAIVPASLALSLVEPKNLPEQAYLSAKADTVSALIADNEKPKLISDQFTFTEGPAVDKKGNIFFTDLPNDKIWKFDTEGKLSLFLEKTRRSDGLYFDKKGNLLAAADEKGELLSISPSGSISILLNNYKGKNFNAPNDLWIDKKGGIYFTDPFYKRPYFAYTEPNIPQSVYYFPKGQKEAINLDSTMVRPNGIVGSADGKHLFVADIAGKKTYKYDINKDGTVSNKSLFADMGSDGMTLDNRGNLYLTGGKGVTVFNKEGQQIGLIELPTGASNVCFSGKERDILFITSRKSIYTLKMKVKGIE